MRAIRLAQPCQALNRLRRGGDGRGLGLGAGLVSVVLGIAIIGLVGYLSATHRDAPDEHADRPAQ